MFIFSSCPQLSVRHLFFPLILSFLRSFLPRPVLNARERSILSLKLSLSQGSSFRFPQRLLQKPKLAGQREREERRGRRRRRRRRTTTTFVAVEIIIASESFEDIALRRHTGSEDGAVGHGQACTTSTAATACVVSRTPSTGAYLSCFVSHPFLALALLILISTFMSFEKRCLMINSYLEKNNLRLHFAFLVCFLCLSLNLLCGFFHF